MLHPNHPARLSLAITSTLEIKLLAEPRPKGAVIRDATQTESWMKGPSRAEARLQEQKP
jgi:hypothetical protein